MIDYNEIGNADPEHIHRPYCWQGEDQDAHVTDFHRHQDVRFGNVGAIRGMIRKRPTRYSMKRCATVQRSDLIEIWRVARSQSAHIKE